MPVKKNALTKGKKTGTTRAGKKPDGNAIAKEVAENKKASSATGIKKSTPADKKTTGKAKSVESINWPVDEDGTPMAMISMAASELVPTGKFANVTIGPATITKFVRDGDGDHLAAEVNVLAETIEQKVIAEQREILNDGLKAGKPKSE